jgi:enamine deaminase RidA (YjgF/YER057c/UK114 family)
MLPSQRLAALNLTLPTPPKPVAAYIPFVRVPMGAGGTGGLLFVSGQIPIKDGKLLAVGIVPGEVSPDEARACARQCALNALAVAADAAGSIDRVRRVVRLGVFVASAPGFRAQPAVANAASELMVELFGEAGRHARAAVGCSDLPLGAPVEVEATFEVE